MLVLVAVLGTVAVVTAAVVSVTVATLVLVADAVALFTTPEVAVAVGTLTPLGTIHSSCIVAVALRFSLEHSGWYPEESTEPQGQGIASPAPPLS